MDTLKTYWRYVWHRLLHPADETRQHRLPLETNDEHIARLPVKRKRLIWLQGGGTAIEVVRFVETTGTYLTSYYYSNGSVSHHHGKPQRKTKNA